jgi:hypothetical protein
VIFFWFETRRGAKGVSIQERWNQKHTKGVSQGIETKIMGLL